VLYKGKQHKDVHGLNIFWKKLDKNVSRETITV